MHASPSRVDGPPADPTSSTDCRNVMGRLPTGVVIVAGMVGGEPVGVAVGSFQSVSLDPPLVGFFIADTSSTWPVIAPSGGFFASIMGAAREVVSRHSAQRGAAKSPG